MYDYRIKKRFSYRSRVLAGVVLVAVVGAIVLYLSHTFLASHSQPQSTKASAIPTSTTQSNHALPALPPKPKVMGIFSGAEFKAIYDQTIYANVQKIISPPPITDNNAADTHIRDLAVSRGYKLRDIATATLVTADDFELQSPAAIAWQAMKAAALVDGLELHMVAGYRTLPPNVLYF